MASPALPEGLRLESLEVGAAPLVRLLLDRLDLPGLFERHLPPLPGRPPALSSAAVLGVLLTNLLLARQPLYALSAWAARRVPEPLGLEPGQTALLNDDRAGRALDHLHRADRASLLTALVLRAVAAFAIDLSEQHQDTTTVTFSGQYAHQAPAEQVDRPPRITFGYNKDHRPDLKQLLYSVTITADGAVPVHCKLYDGNTSDDQVHRDTWLFLQEIIGHSDFLYVADSKLCTRENMSLIADQHGRFLTVMPRTRSEDAWFRDHLLGHALSWREVHRQPNPRRREGPDVVYHGLEGPQRSAEGYRILWYRSSQKEEQDRQARAERLRRARQRLEQLRPPGRQRAFASAAQALAAGQRVLEQEQVTRWLRLQSDEQVEKRHEQLKTVFGVMPMWLKSVARVESLLWLYYGVELVQALVEREVRRQMQQAGATRLALYPEGRASAAPTAALVLSVLEGHRRHRLLDAQGQELRRFHDPLPDAAQEVLALLGVDPTAYGLD